MMMIMASDHPMDSDSAADGRRGRMIIMSHDDSGTDICDARKSTEHGRTPQPGRHQWPDNLTESRRPGPALVR
jgi:hypothetical protein